MRSELEDEDFYKLLEVPQEASPGDIRKAYRRLALKFHPDKNPEHQERAECRFKKIGEAYEVLSNREKRLSYDRFGRAGVASRVQPDFSRFHSFSPSTSGVFDGVFGDDPFKGFFSSQTRNSHCGFQSAPFQDNFQSFFRQSSAGSTFSTGSCEEDSNSSTSGSDCDDDPFNLHDRLFNDHHNIHENLWNNKGFSSGFHSSSKSTSSTCTRSSSVSTKYIQGKRVITRTIIEDGVETITIEENGEVVETSSRSL